MHDSNGAVDALVGGWRISGTFITQSGNPFTVINGKNNSYSQCGNGCTWYPNAVGDPFSNVPAGYYFNPAAFAVAENGTFGNSGRNTLRGPGLTVFNFSLAKGFHFKERFGLEVRADFVNVFNHPSFQAPHNDINQANFGIIDSSLTGNGTTVAPRSGQLSARFTF
jgi:hypothetical protein